jgi:hypothetical protein
MNIVTKSSQMTTCDHFGAFCDVKGTSLMTTSLLSYAGLLLIFSFFVGFCVIKSLIAYLSVEEEGPREFEHRMTLPECFLD